MPETTVRRALLPPVDSAKKRLFGGFAASHSTEDEYAATVYCSEGELQSLLDNMGFSPSLFSALKIRLDGNVEDGSWVRREAIYADEQLHVVTHEREDAPGFDVYAHRECSKVVHPIKHYRTVNYDATAGIEQYRQLLEDYRERTDDPPRYEVHPPHRRSWPWALHLLSVLSTPVAERLGHAVDRLTSGGNRTRRLGDRYRTR